MTFSALIVAAGSGSRAGGDKQWRSLRGKPVLRWSAEALLNAGAQELIVVIAPDAQDRAIVHRVIYDELCLGIVREESRAAYRAVIQRLVDAGARGIILGCTEIELLVGEDDSPVPIFPTTRLHVEAAVEAALSETQPST